MGTINDNKGIFDVINMIISHKEDFVNKFHLTICGKGQCEKLKKLIHENYLTEYISFMGWVDKEEKHKLLSNSDIYIQPSHFEGLGIAIIEAMSYELPIIGTNTGGIPELIEEGSNGYLVPVQDTDLLYDRLIHLYDNRNKIIEMGCASRVRSEMFSQDKIEQELINIYTKLLTS